MSKLSVVQLRRISDAATSEMGQGRWDVHDADVVKERSDAPVKEKTSVKKTKVARAETTPGEGSVPLFCHLHRHQQLYAHMAQHPGYHYNPRSTTYRNEDRCRILHRPRFTLLAVFDGHGEVPSRGDNSSQFLNVRLTQNIANALDQEHRKLVPERIAALLIAEFATVEAEMKANEHLFSDNGSTAVVSIVTVSDIVTANLGDSVALLFDREGNLKKDTVDHDCGNENERQRMALAGNACDLTRPDGDAVRIKSGLMMTRAFGDYKHGESVIKEPQIHQWRRAKFDILALCSDSFAEGNIQVGETRRIGPVYSHEEIARELVSSVRECDTLKEATERAVTRRVNMFRYRTNGRVAFSGDNTTLILMQT